MKLLFLMALLLSSPGLTHAAPAARPLEAAVSANSRFAFDLYGELRAGDDNLFFSPYSIFVALSMAYAGAGGETAEELRRVLHVTLPGGAPHKAVFRLREALGPGRGADATYTLAVANALWGQQDYPFRPSFVRTLGGRYGAGLREVDFADSEPARQPINRWVEDNTRNKIKKLIAEGALSDATRLVLTNAVYFKADWETVFIDGLTQTKPFKLRTGESVAVPMMLRPEEETLYHRGTDYRAVSLPYWGVQRRCSSSCRTRARLPTLRPG